MNAILRDCGGGVWGFDAGGSLGVDDIARMRDTLAALPPDARCLVVTGDRDVFNSGATRAGLIDAGQPITDYVGEIPRMLAGAPVPTVAAMAGHAIGGGLLVGLKEEVVVGGNDSKQLRVVVTDLVRLKAAASSVSHLEVSADEWARVGRIRLRRVMDVSADSLIPFVRDAVAPGSVVHTDGWSG